MSRAGHDLVQQLDRLQAVIEELERGPESPVRARARELVRAVLALHADGLARLLELVGAAGPDGHALARTLARDPLVSSLLLLHGLHPDDLERRARAALDALEPALAAEGARLARLAVDGDIVRVALARAGGRAPAAALQARVQQAILAAAPEAAGVQVEVPDAAAFVPVSAVRLRARSAAGS